MKNLKLFSVVAALAALARLYIDWFKRTWTPRPARPERRVRRYRKGDRCSRETVLKVSRVRPENRRRVQRFRSCSPRCCT